MPRHFLTGQELDREQLLAVLARAHQLKAAPASSDALAGKSVALIFEKPSTRTRLSYEVGVTELGGHAVVLRPGEMQLSRGESIADTARVLSGQVAAVGVRTGPDALIEELAAEGSIPVFNMLTELHHPSQALADLMTLQEAFPDRPLDELKLAYVGDGNNVARSLALMGTTAGLDVVVPAQTPFFLTAAGSDGDAGDVLTFSMAMVHASLDNQSKRFRLSSDSRYQLASEPADERWIGANPIAHGPAGKKGKIC